MTLGTILNESLTEAKSKTPTFIGKSDGKNYAVRFKDVDATALKSGRFGDAIKIRKKGRDFEKVAKVTHIGATLSQVKKWVKENNPEEFYASWEPDSSSWKDDSIKIYYTSIDGNEKVI